MKNLIIDIGNTRIKTAVFESGTLLEEWAYEQLADAELLWASLEFDQVLISSVRYSEKELRQRLAFDFLFLNHQTRIPIANAYATPQSLGLDRIAAAIGAWELSGQREVLAIDLGSCVTYELVDDNQTYRGGAISPGLRMRARAMHEFTANLPLVKVDEAPQNFTGDSTQTCMKSGIWYGIQLEILGQIQYYQKKYPEIKVFVCGGDAQSFDSLAKDHIFVVPNLVLYGLNCILNHNVE
ncbi:type III pantothenate kinase [Algoriphagus faecimaris]|uniref:Type III pantothenate kinase n=1 Tax=Algoriphagus faecimaris TaxID=686796 RepID=A0A1G6NV27_9BACT|nr:type III pantothenate kinase [Algoriphagus faecimaris]SDC71087.1 type III pantothenate kinase [Algoriphagus faecimaris]